jgi:lysophospholipase L1-like esterase
MKDVKLLIVGVVVLLGMRVTHAQLADTYSLPRSANCCLLNTATLLAEQLQDWNQLGRYHDANKALMKGPVEAGRVVFIGDSITDGYRLDEAFPGKPYVNRGISGQTTAQMLVRFYPDVIALKPAAVIMLAGTNDIARHTAAVDAQGFLREGYTNDGLHPNAQGYTLMTPVASAAIAEALKR